MGPVSQLLPNEVWEIIGEIEGRGARLFVDENDRVMIEPAGVMDDQLRHRMKEWRPYLEKYARAGLMERIDMAFGDRLIPEDRRKESKRLSEIAQVTLDF